MHLSMLDIFVVMLYALLMLGVAHFLAPNKDHRDADNLDSALRTRTLPWWAIGTSLIAANISAEQIIGMSGSAYALGLAIASYEWTAAMALLIVGKYLLPIFLKNRIHTMPEFLRRRYGRNIQLIMAIFWLVLYVFVNLTAVLWLGATAVNIVTGLPMIESLILLGLFAGNFALYVGLKAASATDVVQVSMLVLGGLVIVCIALERISGVGDIAGVAMGLQTLAHDLPGHFHLILTPDNPYYKYLPGTAVIFGGMWIVHISYWGFNQYILQRTLTAASVREAQKGVVLAAFLKLLIPVLVVLPGIAAVQLVGSLPRPDAAYPTLMIQLPHGLMGFVFIALVAAIVASMGSTLSSIATIFTRDVVKAVHPTAGDRLMTITGRFTAIVALAISMIAAWLLMQNVDQAFQYIQEFTGFITPGVVVIFLCGIFWPKASETGALAAAAGTVLASAGFKLLTPELPFLHRMGWVLLICFVLMVLGSLLSKPKPQGSEIDIAGVDYSTSGGYNVACLAIVAILATVYTIWW
jgi:solute:Na+ symporter, SSS family